MYIHSVADQGVEVAGSQGRLALVKGRLPAEPHLSLTRALASLYRPVL